MADALILVVGLAVAAVLVLRPLLTELAGDRPTDDDRDAATIRHRVALEALRDVETDRRAGSLIDDAYAEQLAQAEERAVLTRAALDRHPAAERPAPSRRGRRAAFVAAAVIGVALMGGSLVPAVGIGNTTFVNQARADAQAAESARQDRIGELSRALADGPDAETLSALADEYLAGSSSDDQVRAAVSLQLLIELEPERADAYERIMSAYLRAGDAPNARAAHRSYADLATADPIEVAFFDGLIALRGEHDADAAVAAFDRFLELAPDDPRANMIRGLREEAATGS
jgi:hypothetical protein